MVVRTEVLSEAALDESGNSTQFKPGNDSIPLKSGNNSNSVTKQSMDQTQQKTDGGHAQKVEGRSEEIKDEEKLEVNMTVSSLGLILVWQWCQIIN